MEAGPGLGSDICGSFLTHHSTQLITEHLTVLVQHLMQLRPLSVIYLAPIELYLPKPTSTQEGGPAALYNN